MASSTLYVICDEHIWGTTGLATPSTCPVKLSIKVNHTFFIPEEYQFFGVCFLPYLSLLNHSPDKMFVNKETYWIIP